MKKPITESSDLDLYEISEEDMRREPATDAATVAGAAPLWRGGEQRTDEQIQTKRQEVDEYGHRAALVDGEVLTIVEGDLLLDVDQKELWQDALNARQEETRNRLRAQQTGFGVATLNDLGVASSSLIGIVQDGKVVRWSPGTVLTYCVLRHTFPRDEWYQEAVENMQAATAAWEETCGVEFDYRANLDTSGELRPQGVLFPVRYISANGAFIAASFFPNDLASRRRLLIDPSYFTTQFDHVGVLRHELGHILGFRHEHIRSGAPAVCPDESTVDTIDLTAYDPQSVMHYFCGGVGSRSLVLTDVDRAGSQRVYGPPLRTFQLQEA